MRPAIHRLGPLVAGLFCATILVAGCLAYADAPSLCVTTFEEADSLELDGESTDDAVARTPTPPATDARAAETTPRSDSASRRPSLPYRISDRPRRV